MIVAIDPGTTESGYCEIIGPGTINEAYDTGKITNSDLLNRLKHTLIARDAVVIEDIQCMGMSVGAEVFDTAKMIGRIQQVTEEMGCKWYLYKRSVYARYFIGKTRKVTDALLYEALRKRFGWEKGQEPKCFKGASDKRSAFAVGMYHKIMEEGK